MQIVQHNSNSLSLQTYTVRHNYVYVIRIRGPSAGGHTAADTTYKLQSSLCLDGLLDTWVSQKISFEIAAFITVFLFKTLNNLLYKYTIINIISACFLSDYK